jgi:hypothetical protein
MELFGQSWRQVVFVWPPSPPKPAAKPAHAVRIRRLLQR